MISAFNIKSNTAMEFISKEWLYFLHKNLRFTIVLAIKIQYLIQKHLNLIKSFNKGSCLNVRFFPIFSPVCSIDQLKGRSSSSVIKFIKSR